MISGRPEGFGLAAATALIALAVRFTLLGYHSMDYEVFLKPWLHTIDACGGYRALRHDFADYNVPYLYLLVVVSYLPHPLVMIKAASILFDFVLAIFVFRILAYRYSSPVVPLLGACVVLLLPSVIANGAMWGQCDSIYSSFALAGLYYLLRRRPWIACALFGVSFAFKQQAIFSFPILLVLALRRTLPWRALLAVPAMYLVLALPAWLLGRPAWDLLTIYFRQAGQYRQLALEAPSVFQFVRIEIGVDQVRRAGVLVAGAVVLLMVFVLVVAPIRQTSTHLVVQSGAWVILVPFLLPAMHERYFFLADVLSVVLALWLPRRLWYLPILVGLASFFSYLPFLFAVGPSLNRLNLDPRILSTLMFLALVAILAELRRGLDLSAVLARRALD